MRRQRRRRHTRRSAWDAAILERDPVFCSNLANLIERVRQGKVSNHQFRTHRSWLASAALRRHRSALCTG